MACSAEDLPQNKANNPQIGHFAYTAYPEPGTQTFVFPDDVEGLPAVVPLCGDFKTGFFECPGFCACPYVAAHAVVANTGYCQAFATVYGVERGSGDLYEIDVVGSTATLIADINDPFPGNVNSPNGLAWDPSTGRLYFSANSSENDTDSDLYFWDGSAVVSAGTVPGLVAGATFFEGEYYYVKNATDDLVKVQFNPDGTFAALVDVFTDFTANVDSFRFGDIVIYPEMDAWTLYGSSLASNSTSTPPTFFSISSDGTYTEISTASATRLQLAIGSDGVLYGQSTGTGEFFTIDPATGATTSKGVPTGASDGFTDTASGTRCVPPTETAWGFGEGFAGKSWAMYFNPCVCLQPEPSVE
jgi:hypothetical protein